jgi:tetratricopeptide (TPR) repeat protein
MRLKLYRLFLDVHLFRGKNKILIFKENHLVFSIPLSACWSALGDAHLHTNNIKSALSCYSKATLIERETLYSLTRQAFTKTLLARYTEAILLFDKVIEQSPKYILARKGLINSLSSSSHLVFRQR